jgi:hypothetical protein
VRLRALPLLSPSRHNPTLFCADVALRLLGAHQLDNAAAAVAAAACLRQHGLERIDLQAVAAGLEAAVLPGRFQACQLEEDSEAAAAAAAMAAQGGTSSSSGGGGHGDSSSGRAAGLGPWVVLDGAHTSESARALAQTLREVFPTAPVAIVMAMAEDKQHRWGACTCGRLSGCPVAVLVWQCPRYRLHPQSVPFTLAVYLRCCPLPLPLSLSLQGVLC